MVGIGYRKDFAREFNNSTIMNPDFIEVAPENWIDIGGFWGRKFKEITERLPLFTHGLSLSIGSPESPDFDFLKKIKTFIKEYNVSIYSEHLSYSKCDNAHLYDLLPIPFTSDAVKHISKRINMVQDFLEQALTLEIVSYYTPNQPEMSELEFINAILNESKCNLLLDVNNIYVNSFNHRYDPYEFISQLNTSTVSYIHMAGHLQIQPNLIIDTHGEAIIDPVYKLYEFALEILGRGVPVLLERDFNIPELKELQSELNQLKTIKEETLKKLTHVA